MTLSVTSFALAPLLLAQGLYVRIKTPRLNEPNGDRHGVQGDGDSLRLLIAGDSAAAGVGVRHQSEALAGQLVQQLSRYRRLDWRLMAQTGFKARDLLRHLQEMPPATFDVCLLSIGVNDVTGSTSSKAYASELQKLHRLLVTQLGIRRVIFSRIPPMENFPALPRLLAQHLGDQAQALNAAMASFCSEHEDCEFLDWKLPFDPRYMAADGFHPGTEACALWARLVTDQILASRRHNHHT